MTHKLSKICDYLRFIIYDIYDRRRGDAELYASHYNVHNTVYSTGIFYQQLQKQP